MPTEWQPPDPQADLRAALHHAKHVLAEEKAAQSDQLAHHWRLQLRHALQDLTAAVEATRGNQ